MRAGQEHRVIGQGWGQIQDRIAVVQMAAEVAEAGSGLGGGSKPPRSFRVIAEVISMAVMRAM